MDVLPVRESHAGDPVVGAASATSSDTSGLREVLRGSERLSFKKESTMHAGSERRRLAGDHNPYEERPPEPPPSTDYSDLCAELGEWIPMDPLPGNRRASPLIFEGILRDLEESDFSGSPPSTSASSVIREDTSSQAPYSSPDLKRLASGVFQVEDEEDEEPGPSWKHPRIHAASPSSQSTHLPQDQQAPYSAAYSASSSWLPSGTHAPKSSLHPPHAAAVQAPIAQPIAASALPTLPSASFTRATSPSELFRRSHAKPRPPSHPYVRLPAVQPGIIVNAFLPSKMRCSTCVRRSPLSLLRRVRELLLREEIGKSEADELVTHAELIANHLLLRISSDISDKKPFDAARHLARRFMAFNAIVSISRALDLGWQAESWWSDLAREVSTSYPVESLDLPGVYPFHADLMRDMMHALQLYKAGSYPEDTLVLSIKRRLFSAERGRCFLGDACWAPWRDDDRDSSR